MNLTATIILLCVGSVALLIGSAVLYYRLVHRNRKTRKWVKRVEAAQTDSDTVAIYDITIYITRFSYDGYCPLRDTARQSAAIIKYNDATLRTNARRHRIEFDKIDTPYDRAYSYVLGSQSNYPYDLAFGQSEEEVAQNFISSMAETLALVRAGDLVAMHGYMQVMNHGTSKFCDRHKITPPAYPSDWDDIVTNFVPNPSVSDFKGTPELAAGDVRLKAAEALRTRSRKLAKLVLAYCLVEREVLGDPGYGSYRSDRSRQTVWPFRDAIGDTLLAQLITMVESMEGSTTYSQAIKLNKPAN